MHYAPQAEVYAHDRSERAEVLIRHETDDEVGSGFAPAPFLVLCVFRDPIDLRVVENGVVIWDFQSGLRFRVRDVDIIGWMVFEQMAAI